VNVPTTDVEHDALDARLDALTDEEWAAIDRLARALENATGGLSPSVAARNAKVRRPDGRPDTATAAQLLALMVPARLAFAYGNGARTRYHAYDRYRDPTLTRSRRTR
jgi:hypothetical protein